MIFGKSQRRQADTTNKPRLKILSPADKVEHFACFRVEKHAVHRKISPQGILAGVGKSDGSWMPSVGIACIGSERGDFHLSGLARAKNRNHTKCHTDRKSSSAAEKISYLFGKCCGCNVVIDRNFPQNFISNTSSGPVRLMARRSKRLNNLGCKLSGRDRIKWGWLHACSSVIWLKKLYFIGRTLWLNCFFWESIAGPSFYPVSPAAQQHHYFFLFADPNAGLSPRIP